MARKFHKPKPRPADAMVDSGDKSLVDKVKSWKDDSEGLVSTWESNQEKWHRMRMRIKKSKNSPFPGCSNLRMPTIETKIRKLKAALSNVLFGIRPIVQAIPEVTGNWQTAIKIEKFLDHLLMEKANIKDKVVIAIDQALEKGFYLIKPYWKTEITSRVETLSLKDITVEEALWLFDPKTPREMIIQAISERVQADLSEMVRSDNLKEIENITDEILSGKEEVKFTLKDVLCNYPDISLCSPERVYVPTTSGYNPQNCEYIIHEFFVPFGTLKQNASFKGWDMSSVNKIKDIGQTDLDDKNIEIDKDTREGIERLQSTSGLVKIWECYCWYDINNDGEQEKCVITIAPDFSVVLRKITLPFYSGKFPFIKLFYELCDDRWFSHRGIPELIEDIVKEIDIQHNQKIDYQTMANTPMFLGRAGQVNRNMMQFVFGQVVPVNGMQSLDDILKPMNKQNPNIEFSYEREQMMLETKVEELIGQVDFTLQSMINKRQPRTLGEVQLQNQNMQQVFSLDADMFRESMANIINWFWDLWSQYGDDQYEFSYFGKNGWERIRLTREETQGKYKITVRGNDQNTNPQVRLQKAQAIMMGIQNQIALQTGVITPVHIANAYKRFYQELDIPNWEELVSTPQQIMQMMQQKQQTPPPTDIKLKGEDLTELEQAQVLKRQGIQPDIVNRMERGRREVSASAIDQLSKVADSIGYSEGEENAEY